MHADACARVCMCMHVCACLWFLLNHQLLEFGEVVFWGLGGMGFFCPTEPSTVRRQLLRARPGWRSRSQAAASASQSCQQLPTAGWLPGGTAVTACVSSSFAFCARPVSLAVPE